MADPRTKAKQLMALALRSDFEQEGRTAAMAAVRLIEEHDMLARPRGLGAPPARITSDFDARAEIEELRRQIALLQRAPAPPKPKALPPSPYTTYALIDLAAKMREIEQLRGEVARLQGAQRMHVVRPGDTATSIAQLYTGNPARFAELVASNPQKSSYSTPGGARMFTSLVVGEQLLIPQAWVR